MSELNADLIRQTIRTMEEHELMWAQREWVYVPTTAHSCGVDRRGVEGPVCGTTLCFAGFAMLVKLGPEEFYSRSLDADEWDGVQEWYTTDWADSDLRYEAAEALGLSDAQADRLFSSIASNLDAYKALVTEVTGVAL